MRFKAWGRSAAAVCLLLMLCSTSGYAQEISRPRWSKRWIISVATLAAASFADVYTSKGKFEANPLLRDPTGRASVGKMVAFKTGAIGGTVLVEALLARKQESGYKSATILNFGLSAAYGTLAVRNAGIPRAADAP